MFFRSLTRTAHIFYITAKEQGTFVTTKSTQNHCAEHHVAFANINYHSEIMYLQGGSSMLALFGGSPTRYAQTRFALLRKVLARLGVR